MTAELIGYYPHGSPEWHCTESKKEKPTMIPPADVLMDSITAQRWNLTCIAAALTRQGVNPALIMVDTREGIDLGQQP